MDDPADMLTSNDRVQPVNVCNVALNGLPAVFGTWRKVNGDDPRAPLFQKGLYRAANEATGPRHKDCLSVHACQFPPALDPRRLSL